MSDKDEGEVEIRMEASEDKKVITLVFISSIPMDTYDLVLAIDAYVADLTRAIDQKEKPDTNMH